MSGQPVVDAPERKGYTSPLVQRRAGFNPAECSPEQWAAIIWTLNQVVDSIAVVDEDQQAAILERVQVLPSRLSAEEPRTGDCLELAAAPGEQGRRFFFVKVDPARVIADPVAWGLLCRQAGATVHLGGLPA